MIKSGVYQIRNLINNKVYVGSAVDINRRKREHYTQLSKGKHCNQKLQNAYNKYGVENFSFEIVESVKDLQQLISQEQYYIDKFNAVNEGYNICPIAGNTLGVYPSNESRQKMSEAHKGVGKGIPKSEEHKKKISKSVSNSIKGENNKYYGKHLSEEHKRKISLANKGKHSKPRKQ